jgi:hypothetical protein
MREAAWENWAISRAQIAFLGNGAISEPQVESGLALPQGATGLHIEGVRWPASLRLVHVPQNAQAFLHTTDSYAFILTFAQGWSVDAVFSGGNRQPLSDQVAPAGATDFVVGRLVTKPTLGDLWYGSAGLGCVSSNPPSLQALCAE